MEIIKIRMEINKIEVKKIEKINQRLALWKDKEN